MGVNTQLFNSSVHGRTVAPKIFSFQFLNRGRGNAYAIDLLISLQKCFSLFNAEFLESLRFSITRSLSKITAAQTHLGQ